MDVDVVEYSAESEYESDSRYLNLYDIRDFLQEWWQPIRHYES